MLDVWISCCPSVNAVALQPAVLHFQYYLLLTSWSLTINVLINDKFISTALAMYNEKISSHSWWHNLWRYKVTENKISNDIEQDIYIPQIIVAVITPSNSEEWTASVMILAYKGKGDPRCVALSRGIKCNKKLRSFYIPTRFGNRRFGIWRLRIRRSGRTPKE